MKNSSVTTLEVVVTRWFTTAFCQSRSVNLLTYLFWCPLMIVI